MLIKIKKPNSFGVFPQANDILKLIKYVNLKTYKYYDSYLSTIDFNIVERQISYYKSAANYLGLMNGNFPSKLAYQVFELEKNKMLISIVQLILENEIFYKYFKNRNIFEVIYYLINTYNMSKSTATRRASTVKAWVGWCDVIIRENDITVKVGD